MTDQMRISGNVIRGSASGIARIAAPGEGMVIKGNVVVSTGDTRDSGEPEVDPSAGEDRAE